MKLFFPLIAFALAIATPAFADEKTDAAIRALDALEADPVKLEPFCAIVKEMSSLGEGDDVKSEELEVKMEEYLTSLGPDYASAWSIGEDLDPSSAEAAKLDAAFDRIEQKCGE
ncbi:MAG: hypothetical protein U1E67_12040 [Hyphomicrobiales bacterium]